MCYPHRRVCRVDTLSARPGCAIDIDAQVLLVHLYIGVFLDFGDDIDRSERSMPPFIRIERRYPYQAVDAALGLQITECVIAFYQDCDVLDAGFLPGQDRKSVGGGEG